MNGAELLVRCLEREGVRYVFGVPGEETLDVNDALARSSIQFIPVRHEQAAAFMADVWGRLTGQAGVCLATLGPGATNLATGLADANLDRAPVVAITGQLARDLLHKESHQYVDIVDVFRPFTKWNARIETGAVVAEAVRKAFKRAQEEKPGACHLELPEDVARGEAEGEPLAPGHAASAVARPAVAGPRRRGDQPGRAPADPRRQRRDPWPSLARAHGARRARADSGRHHVHGQGRDRLRSPAGARHRGPGVGRSGAMSASRDADLVIAVGYDPVECGAGALEPHRPAPHRAHRLHRRPRSTRATSPRSRSSPTCARRWSFWRRWWRSARSGRRPRGPPRTRGAHDDAFPGAPAADHRGSRVGAGARRPRHLRRRRAQALGGQAPARRAGRTR